MPRFRFLARGATAWTMMLGVVTGCFLAGAPAAEVQRNPNLPEINAEAIYGKITDQYGQLLRARVELWYPNLDVPVTQELGQVVTGAASYERQLFQAVHADPTGHYHLETIPGRWLVRVSKGPEYMLHEFEVTAAREWLA